MARRVHEAVLVECQRFGMITRNTAHRYTSRRRLAPHLDTFVVMITYENGVIGVNIDATGIFELIHTCTW